MDVKVKNKAVSGGPASRSGKQSDKRRELALHTLSALAEFGFAHINLREIAARSGISLGAIHYYFNDKTDLLIYCVQLYKDDFVLQLEEAIASANNPSELVSQFSDALAHAVEEHAHLHRLWYDVRAQALFDKAFQPVVEEIETHLIGVARQFLMKMHALDNAFDATDELSTYVMVDGWFRYFLQQHIAGNAQACAALRQRLEQIAQDGRMPA
jgi:AcrR family transcriptional regulator